MNVSTIKAKIIIIIILCTVQSQIKARKIMTTFALARKCDSLPLDFFLVDKSHNVYMGVVVYILCRTATPILFI